MSIDLDALVQTMRITAGHTAPVVLMPHEARVLVAEVERLRGKSVCDDALRERAAVVAYLLRDFDTDDSRDRAAEAIRNGEHRRGEDKS